MELAITLLCSLAATLRLATPEHIRVVVSADSQTVVVPFLLSGKGIAQVSANCPRGFPVRLYHKSDPDNSLCNSYTTGSVQELNSWAHGVVISAPALPTESVVEIEIRKGSSSETVTLHVETVTNLHISSAERTVRLSEEGKMYQAATLDIDHMPPNVKLTVLPLSAWPDNLSAFFVGHQMYLRADAWPLPFSSLSVEFRIKDEHSSLLSRPISLKVDIPTAFLNTISTYLLLVGGVVIFLFSSLLYVFFAVFRVSIRESVPDEPTSDAVSRWNNCVLSEIKSQKSFASTRASSAELAFRDVTLERISPLELSQATVASSDLDGLSGIGIESGWLPSTK